MHYAMSTEVFNSLPAPAPVVGRRMHVMYRAGSVLIDLLYSTSTVVNRVKRNGSFVLSNGMQFDASGYGLSGCRALVAHNWGACKRQEDGSLVLVGGDAVPGWPQ